MGVPKSDSEAHFWYQRAAAQSHAKAKDALGPISKSSFLYLEMMEHVVFSKGNFSHSDNLLDQLKARHEAAQKNKLTLKIIDGISPPCSRRSRILT